MTTWQHLRRPWTAVLCLTVLALAVAVAQQPTGTAALLSPGYILGPDDQLTVRVLNLEETKDDKPVRIDMRGNIALPLAGRIHAAGLTVEQLEALIRERFKAVLQTPEVTVALVELRSQPVSVLGAVKSPGVVQVRGGQTLFEVLSMAGGMNADAGNTIKITRRKGSGALPLPNVRDDESGQYAIGVVKVKELMEARNPEENIAVMPYDVVSVPKGEMVYVIGCVKRSGGFVLNEREKLSVLQALSLAEGLDRYASAKGSKILRAKDGADDRQEIPVDLKRIMGGKAGDIALLANDILFVPTSGKKAAVLRTVDAAITLGTGIAIYRR